MPSGNIEKIRKLLATAANIDTAETAIKRLMNTERSSIRREEFAYFNLDFWTSSYVLAILLFIWSALI